MVIEVFFNSNSDPLGKAPAGLITVWYSLSETVMDWDFKEKSPARRH
jgi:hypothetical protein